MSTSRLMPDLAPCPCLNEPQRFDHYEEVESLGVDATNGRYAAVTLWQCKRCGRYWLRYQVEYEHLTASGRYFMGLITLERARELTPENSVEYLESLDWHLYGGSYFGGTGKSTSKRLPVD